MKRHDVLVQVPPPFSFELTVRKPAGWHWSTPTERYEDSVLLTSLRLSNSQLVGLKVNQVETGEVRVQAFSTEALGDERRSELVERVKEGLGVSDDLSGFYSLGQEDELVAKVSDDLHGMRLGFAGTVFERALLAICLQMTRLKRSRQMMNCLIQSYGDTARFDDATIRHWPPPERLSRIPVNELADECNLGYRAKYIREVADQVASDFPTVLELANRTAAEAHSTLKELYGVGDYSAQIISPHSGFPLDVWSARIFHEILFGETPEKPREVIQKVEEEAKRRWGDYVWHVFVYALNDLDNLSRHHPLTKLT